MLITPLATIDALIAQLAITHNLVLATYDNDFLRLSGITKLKTFNFEGYKKSKRKRNVDLPLRSSLTVPATASLGLRHIASDIGHLTHVVLRNIFSKSSCPRFARARKRRETYDVRRKSPKLSLILKKKSKDNLSAYFLNLD
ncbi:PIN domain-containing protein [Leptospira weilii]|uniref:PIN domain-containing protein n=1 Tax=Leptospira weilii TaxID=28184 RepID=UPI00308403D4